jgi:hypothetical protein
LFIPTTKEAKMSSYEPKRKLKPGTIPQTVPMEERLPVPPEKEKTAAANDESDETNRNVYEKVLG